MQDDLLQTIIYYQVLHVEGIVFFALRIGFALASVYFSANNSSLLRAYSRVRLIRVNEKIPDFPVIRWISSEPKRDNPLKPSIETQWRAIGARSLK